MHTYTAATAGAGGHASRVMLQEGTRGAGMVAVGSPVLPAACSAQVSARTGAKL